MNLNCKNTKLVLTTLILFVLASCKEKNDTKMLENEIEVENKYVEVITNGMDFEMVDEVNSGWTTFK